jgi:hypothetical protein
VSPCPTLVRAVARVTCETQIRTAQRALYGKLCAPHLAKHKSVSHKLALNIAPAKVASDPPPRAR